MVQWIPPRLQKSAKKGSQGYFISKPNPIINKIYKINNFEDECSPDQENIRQCFFNPNCPKEKEEWGTLCPPLPPISVGFLTAVF